MFDHVYMFTLRFRCIPHSVFLLYARLRYSYVLLGGGRWSVSRSRRHVRCRTACSYIQGVLHSYMDHVSTSFHCQGVGYSALVMVFLENVYYIIVIAWTIFYLFQTFMDMPSLPWSDCSKGSKCICLAKSVKSFTQKPEDNNRIKKFQK